MEGRGYGCVVGEDGWWRRVVVVVGEDGCGDKLWWMKVVVVGCGG